MPGPLLISYGALWILVVVQGLILLGLTRALYEMREEYAEQSSFRGRRVPQFAAVDVSGELVTSETIDGSPAALLFVSPDCSSCMVTLAELEPLATDAIRGLIVVCNGDDNDCRQLAQDHELTVPIVADVDGELMRLFGVSGTPMAVRIDEHGVIESYGEPARGEELARLLADDAGSGESGIEVTEADGASV